MSTIVIELSPDTRKALEELARQTGKPLEELTCELIERGLQAREVSAPKSAREALEQANRLSPLSDALQRRIISGVSLDEVRAAMSRVSAPSLSQIISDQRGAKP